MKTSYNMVPEPAGFIGWRIAMIVMLAVCPAILHSAAVNSSAVGPTVFSAVAGDDDDDDDDEIRFQTVSRLTLSFAPDGTPISRYKSSLFSSFSDLLSADQIESLVLEAFQVWAQHSAVNVGLVSDSGDAFGIGGQSQGDPRFGDIRVGAVPMAGDVFAIAVRNLDFVSGTWSGDLLFNSNAEFADAEQFFAVALHEAGHVLGLGHNDDPTSVMHPTALTGQLNATDVAELKLLYGERLDLDQFDEPDDDGEGVGGNDTMGDAEEIQNTGSIDGMIPLVVFGDIESSSDVDYFKVRPNSDYNGRLTFRLLSQSVSLLRARITVTNESGQVLAVATETSDRGSDISVSLNNVSDDQFYFVRIESTGSAANRFGSYALATTFDDNLVNMLNGSMLLKFAARRNYGDLSQSEIQELFMSNLAAPIADDMHTNDTAPSATVLMPQNNIALHSVYRIQASLADPIDIDFYQVQAFDSVMSVRVNALGTFGLIPDLVAFDSNLQPIPGNIKVNGNGELLVEYTNLVIGGSYFVAVSADRPTGEFGIGNYDLNVAFNDFDREVELLAAGHLTALRPTKSHSLYVARSQLFHFSLAGLMKQSNPEATVWMSIHNEAGAIQYRVATRPGETRTARSVVLTPGSYSIRMHLALPPGSAAGSPMVTRRSATVGYQVFGIGISEPTGPEIIDPSQDPFAPCDKMSSDFCYPNNRFSPNPFIVVEEDEVALPGSVPNPPWQDANMWYWQTNWLG